MGHVQDPLEAPTPPPAFPLVFEQGPARPFRPISKCLQFHFQWFRHLEGCSHPRPQRPPPGSPGHRGRSPVRQCPVRPHRAPGNPGETPAPWHTRAPQGGELRLPVETGLTSARVSVVTDAPWGRKTRASHQRGLWQPGGRCWRRPLAWGSKAAQDQGEGRSQRRDGGGRGQAWAEPVSPGATRGRRASWARA